MKRVSLVIFLIFLPIMLALRFWYPMKALPGFGEGFPTGLRMLGSALVNGFYIFFHAISQMLFVNHSESGLHVPSTWDYYEIPPSELSIHIIYSAYVLAIVVMFIPWLRLSWTAWQNAWGSSLFIFGLIICLSGWPPLFIDSFFHFMLMFVDWPPAYYMFSQRLHLYDIASIGFTGCLLWFMASYEYKIWQIAIIAAIGQLCFENLGLLTGISVAVFAVMQRKSMKLVLAHLFSAGGGVVITLALQIIFITHINHNADIAVNYVEGSLITSIHGYLNYYWENFGKNNFAWWKTILANIITLLAISGIWGMILGIIPGYQGESKKQTIFHLKIGLAVAVAWSIIVFIGMFNSGIASEIGRQLSPFTVVVFFIGMKAGSLGGILLKELQNSVTC